MSGASAVSGWITCLLLLSPVGVFSQISGEAESQIPASPRLPYHAVEFSARPPVPGWESGTVSWVAFGGDGLIYEIQRGDRADTVLVLDREGRLLRSWGKGSYAIPHSIRIDPSGNVWTVDASLSTVIKYSRQGRKLMTIRVGEQPNTDSPFNGATDIAFAPDGHLLIADGYGNARILEYSADGKRLKQWGTPGNGPGEFQLPHSIQVASDGTVYVADRENGRIEKFDREGKYLAEYPNMGRVYSLKLSGEVLWASTQPLDKDPESAGWIVELDPNSGRLLGHIDVPDALALHSIDLSPAGEPVTTAGNHLLWFRHE
jgi:DNA-binding beta-propeller fold protein YncE